MDTPTRIDIDYVANLARIALSDEERKLYSGQIEGILKYIEALKAVDVDGVEPTAHAFPVTNVWREDAVHAGLTQEEALGNAPDSRDGMFVVPKVVE